MATKRVAVLRAGRCKKTGRFLPARMTVKEKSSRLVESIKKKNR